MPLIAHATAGEDGKVKIVSPESLLVHLAQESTANLNRQKVDDPNSEDKR